MDAIIKLSENMGFEIEVGWKENMGFEIEVGWKEKERKKILRESIKKLKDIGDESKLSHAKNLYIYYSIFDNLHFLLKSHPILIEKEVKYHCEDFYHYLDDKIIDSSKRIITGIISAVSNDEPLDSFYKYLMFPNLYREEYKKEKLKSGSEELI